jgi:uncharacterized protein (DUF488 family)
VDSVTKVYTVGHGLQALDDLLNNLAAHSIDLVVDVRSHPSSSRAPHFSRESLREAVAGRGIEYAWMGRALGGRPGAELRTANGAPDYERMALQPATADALDRLADAAPARKIALLCSESRPEHCHRSRMLEPELEKRGVAVDHILPDGQLVSRPTLFA